MVVAAREARDWAALRAPQESLTRTHKKTHCKNKKTSYLPSGFIINGVQVEGAVLCLPDAWLLWDVGGWADAAALEALAVLDVMSPPPEVLVLGCGARMRRVPAALVDALAARDIAVEALDTVSSRKKACFFCFSA